MEFKISRMFVAACARLIAQALIRYLCFYRSLLDFLDDKDLVLVELLVHRKLASLSESLGAPVVRASKWLLTGVNVGVFF